jgi:hypothetical protein
MNNITAQRTRAWSTVNGFMTMFAFTYKGIIDKSSRYWRLEHAATNKTCVNESKAILTPKTHTPTQSPVLDRTWAGFQPHETLLMLNVSESATQWSSRTLLLGKPMVRETCPTDNCVKTMTTTRLMRHTTETYPVYG